MIIIINNVRLIGRSHKTVLMSKEEKEFSSLEKAMYVSIGFELVGALLFFLTALYVVSDRSKAEEAEKLEDCNVK